METKDKKYTIFVLQFELVDDELVASEAQMSSDDVVAQDDTYTVENHLDDDLNENRVNEIQLKSPSATRRKRPRQRDSPPDSPFRTSHNIESNHGNSLNWLDDVD